MKPLCLLSLFTLLMASCLGTGVGNPSDPDARTDIQQFDATTSADAYADMTEDIGMDIGLPEMTPGDLGVDFLDAVSGVDPLFETEGDVVTGVEEGFFHVQIPSVAGGDEGIAVKVTHPAADSTRFADGAPIVVLVQGGWDHGHFDAVEAMNVPAYGYVLIELLLPGGVSTEGHSSGGTFDYRGWTSARALADVLRYATGDLADDEGLTITDRLFYALTDEVGVVGGSNGGNLVITTLARHGDELQSIRWFIAWESPIGDQYINTELNGNPYYAPGTCDATSCPWPDLVSHLAWDSTAETRAITWSAAEIPPAPGRLVLEPENESDPATGLFSVFSAGPGDSPDRPHLYPSIELAAAARLNQPTLWPTGVPPWLVIDEAESMAFWEQRDGSLSIPPAHTHLPDLLVFHLGSVTDHAQDQPDYPHARSHVQGWMDVGHSFVRINPDAVYMALATGEDVSQFPDNPANSELPSWADTVTMMVSDGFENGLMLGGLLEAFDRIHYGVTDANLDAVLLVP